MPDLFATELDASTRYCAVYGHPVKHSASPAMQNAGIAALGLNWRYLAFDVHPEDLRAAIQGAQAMGFIGINLTVPHKVAPLEMMDALDESATTWGAMNTIRFEGKDPAGLWRPLGEFAADALPRELRAHGFNTDAEALELALREDLGVSLAGRSVLLLGAGGAGRMAALKLASAGVRRLFLENRTRGKAVALAAEIHERFPKVTVELGLPGSPIDLVLNATSLGLKAEDALPLDPAKFPLSQARAVYDMIYRPAETPLLQAAKAAGCRAANGIGMLLYQGARALELWTGHKAPITIMRAELVKNVYGAVL